MTTIVYRSFKTIEVTTGVEKLIAMTALLVCAVVRREKYHCPLTLARAINRSDDLSHCRVNLCKTVERGDQCMKAA